MRTFENKINNYFYLSSLKNIANALQKEKERDTNDLRFLLNDFDDEIKISDKAQEEFVKNKGLKIKREEENLILSKNELIDENIKHLSQIKFNFLKEINLSENKITSIDFLYNLNLPYLELLNLSHNQIKKIEPLGKINSKNLKYLFIQNNEIENIQVFIDYYSNFKLLEILRLDHNNYSEDSVSFNEIKKKYDTIMISDSYVEKIRRDFHIMYDNQSGTIKVNNTNESDSILRSIFIIISENNNIRIKKLDLSSNKIVDPSLLNRIQFCFLNDLILSGNNIKNLNFLKGMKAQNLNNLYLDHNYINDLSPLINPDIKTKVFPNIRLISLSTNNFDIKEPKNKKILKMYEDIIEPIP